MRLYLVVPGVLLALAGVTFTLQGLGMVGPSSSFMYETTTWVVWGLVAIFAGLLLMFGGIWMGRPRRSG